MHQGAWENLTGRIESGEEVFLLDGSGSGHPDPIRPVGCDPTREKPWVFFFFFAHPCYYFHTFPFSFSLPLNVTQIRGHYAGSSPPPRISRPFLFRGKIIYNARIHGHTLRFLFLLRGTYSFLFCSSHLLCSRFFFYIASSLDVNQLQGHKAGSFPPPRYGTCLRFDRKKEPSTFFPLRLVSNCSMHLVCIATSETTLCLLDLIDCLLA